MPTRVRLTRRERAEQAEQRRLLREHQRITASERYRQKVLDVRRRAAELEERRLLAEHLRAIRDPAYRRQVDRAREIAERRLARAERPSHAQVEAATALFEAQLRAHYDRMIDRSVSEFRARVEKVKPRPRAMGAREFRAKLRVWSSENDAANDLGVDVRVLRRWGQKGVPGPMAGEVRAEHARMVELARLQSEYLAVGKQLLRSARERPRETWPGRSRYESRRRVGQRWYSQLDPAMLTPQRVHDLIEKWKRLRGKGTHWQGTIRLVFLYPAALEGEVRHGGSGAAYGRVVAVPENRDGELDIGGMVDVPIQTLSGPQDMVLDDLENALLEAIDEHGSVMIDDAILHNFDLKA